MKNTKQPDHVGVISFRFDNKVYLLQDSDHQTIVYKSQKAAVAAIADARRRVMESGGMVGLLGDVLFDFRAHDIHKDDVVWWPGTMGATRDIYVEFGGLVGFLMMANGSKEFHESGKEAMPRFKMRQRRPARSKVTVR